MASFQATPLSAEPLDKFFSSSDSTVLGVGNRTVVFPRFGVCMKVAEQIADFLAVIAALSCADELYMWLRLGQRAQYGSSTLLIYAAGFASLFLILLERHGAYRPSVSLLAIRETERVLRATLEAVLLALVIVYFSQTPVSRLLIMLCALCVPLFVTLEKWQTFRLMHALRRRGWGTQKAVILGAGDPGRRICSALLRSPKFGLAPVAFVDDDPQKQGLEIYESSYQRKQPLQVLPGPICPELLQQLGASVLVVAATGIRRESALKLTQQMSGSGVNTYFVTSDFMEPGYWIDYSELDGNMLAHFWRGSQTFNAVSKRLLDFSIALFLLILLAPLLAIIALAVKLTSPGLVLFRQVRIGQGGVPFTMYKFRTMFLRAPQYACSPQTGSDPRITNVGRWLRRLSLDELPQLINVAWGDMSLVGPRPEMPFIVEQYTPLQRQRLLVKPGITGLWQLSADRDHAIHENMEYDLYYVRHRSVWMDCAVLIHTCLFAARGV